VSGVLRLPPKKSFLVENLGGRGEPEVVVGVVGLEGGAEGGGAVNIGVGYSGVGRGYH